MLYIRWKIPIKACSPDPGETCGSELGQRKAPGLDCEWFPSPLVGQMLGCKECTGNPVWEEL